MRPLRGVFATEAEAIAVPVTADDKWLPERMD